MGLIFSQQTIAAGVYYFRNGKTFYINENGGQDEIRHDYDEDVTSPPFGSALTSGAIDISVSWQLHLFPPPFNHCR